MTRGPGIADQPTSRSVRPSHLTRGLPSAPRGLRALVLGCASVAVLSAPISGQERSAPGQGAAPQGAQPAPPSAQGRSSQLDRVFQGLSYRQVSVTPGLSGGIDPVASPPGAAAEAVLSVSPHDVAVRYRADGRVLRSSDGGATWTPVSPELGEAAGEAELSAIAESPVEPGLLWVGDAEGGVHLSRDAGATWTRLELPPSVGEGRIRAIEPSAHRGGRAFVVIDGRAAGDPRPLALRTEDYGASWTLLTGERNGVPEDHTVTVLREDPEEARLLFAGTPRGVYVSFDGGGSWDLFRFGLPDAFVHDLRIVGRDLVVATEGSGYWMMDDIGPLRQVMEGLTAGEPYLFEPAPTYLEPLGAPSAGEGSEGPDAARGAIFDYLLPSNVRNVRLEVVHPEGRVVATFSGAAVPRATPGGVAASPGGVAAPAPTTPGAAPGGAGEPTAVDTRRVPGTRAGVHRIVWDLMVEDPASGGGAARAVPGTYRLRLTVDGLVREREFEIVDASGLR